MTSIASPAEAKALAAEHPIAWVRLAVILFNVGVYYFVLPPGTGIPWLAGAISAIALAYGFFVVIWQPYRWWPVLRAAMFTALTDGLLIFLWVAGTGGFDSPFYLLWLISMMAVAFRYESKATLVATGFYISSYLALLVWEGTLVDNWADAMIRCMYILLSGALGAILARDSAAIFAAHFESERRLIRERRENELRELVQLRELDRFKSEFINTAAHELNTPITPLKLQLHLLESMQGAGDAEQRKKAVEILARNVERMSLLVDDMLVMARLQSGKLPLELKEVDVAILVRDVGETYQATAANRGIKVVVDGPDKMVAMLDGKRVNQILYNLVSNAIKFSPTNSTIRIKFYEDRGWLVLEVQDEGVGFTERQYSAMFVPFSQVHKNQVNVPGTGLGLVISRGIAERHGGTLEGRSPGPAKGATFICRLPRMAQDSSTAAA